MILATAAGNSGNIEGSIRITSTELLSTFILPHNKIIKAVTTKYRDRSYFSTNNESNLHRRDADIAIRSFRPKQADLIVKKLLKLQDTFTPHPTTLSIWATPQL